MAQALSRPGGPIILVDSADNIGGGTPGDGAEPLRAIARWVQERTHAAAAGEKRD